MVTDWRKVLDAVAARAGELYIVVAGHRGRAEPGDVRSKCFRHTYCATRFQTTDGGKPVAVYTVSRELGHSSTGMVEAVYSHLGDVRPRARRWSSASSPSRISWGSGCGRSGLAPRAAPRG